MMREISYLKEYDFWVSKIGSIAMLEEVRGWAIEFEKKHMDTDWGEEDVDWESQIVEFLNVKLNK